MNPSRPLDSIPDHLILKCIKKMEPRSFARVYRSSLSIKEHIDCNERRISISLPYKLSIETISERNVIVVKAIKGQVVFWQETFSPEEAIEVVIPSLACFNFSSISLHFDSSSHADGYVDKLLSTLQKYRITSRHGSVSHSNPYIPHIVKTLRLKELEIRGPIYNSFGESWLYSEEVCSLNKLSVDRTDGPLAEHLLRRVAARCQSVELKFLGRVEVYLGLLTGCLKDIQVKGEMRYGKVSIAQIGHDVPDTAILDQFDGTSYRLTEELGHSLLLLPCNNGSLLLAWRKYYTPLKKLRGMNFVYGTVRDVDDARTFFQMVYSKTQKETVDLAVELYRKRYL